MSNISDLIAKNNELLNLNVKEIKKQKRAEQAFQSQLSKTNKRRRTKKKRNYSGKGYSYIEVNGKQVLEHRHIMEEHLGRKLLDHEAVYFKDGDKENLDISNLQLGMKPGTKEAICPHCNHDIFSV